MDELRESTLGRPSFELSESTLDHVVGKNWSIGELLQSWVYSYYRESNKIHNLYLKFNRFYS